MKKKEEAKSAFWEKEDEEWLRASHLKAVGWSSEGGVGWSSQGCGLVI